MADDETTQGVDDAELRPGQMHSVPQGRLLAREVLRGKYIFVTPNNSWFRWSGVCWEPTELDRMQAVAADWAKSRIARMMVDPAVPDEWVRSMVRYREVRYLRDLLVGARTDTELLVSASELDRHPGLLNCTNGIVDLRTGALGPHDPSKLLTKCTGVDYRARASHPDWLKAQGAVPDEETLLFLRDYYGASATGETDQCLPVLFEVGSGANGKTTFVSAVRAALGDYAVLVPDKLLTGRSDEHDAVYMPLMGARLAYIEELPDGHALPLARIKKLSDTPEITARPMGGNYVTFRATHALVVNTNHLPRVGESNHATWRRLAVVPFPLTFSPDPPRWLGWVSVA